MSMDEGQPSGIQFYSKVRIKGQDIAQNNILSVTIREWVIDILPRLELTIVDSGAILESITLEDNDEIEIILAKHSGATSQLSMKFLLHDYSVSVSGDNRMFTINISAHMKVSDMFQMRTRGFGRASSIDVLKRIAGESGLKFSNPRGVVSSDSMNWLQVNKSNYNFIKHVLTRSHVFNDAEFFYADHNSKFVLTSLNKEIDKKEEKTAKFDVSETESKSNESDNTIYYNAYDIVNKSGYYNKLVGYGTKAKYYDLKDPKSIDVTTFKKMTNLSFKDKAYNGKIVSHKDCGTYNDLNLYSEKYYESLVRNDFLINTFFGFSVVIQIDSNENVDLFDKINLVMPSAITKEFNEVFSGSYVVGGIIHNIQSGGIYKKMLSLHRNGMNKSETVKTPRNA